MLLVVVLLTVGFADIPYSATVAAQDPETNATGLLYSHKMMPEFLKRADVHVIKVQKAFTAASTAGYGQDIIRYGLSLGGDFAMIDWRAVYNAHSGDYIVTGNGTAVTKSKADANMMEFELGANFEEFMKSRVYVLYHRDTGDDSTTTDKNEGYQSFFYDKHYNAGLMDVVGWGNLTDIALGYTMAPMDSTTVGLHYHMFSRTESRGAITAGLNGSDATSNVNTGANAKDKIGDELDLVATHNYDNGFSMTGRLGMFMPGDALKDTNNATPRSDTYTTVYVQAKMNF